MQLFYYFTLFWPCGTACRIFPNQGSNPCPLQWKHRVLTTEPPGSPTLSFNVPFEEHSLKEKWVTNEDELVLWFVPFFPYLLMIITPYIYEISILYIYIIILINNCLLLSKHIIKNTHGLNFKEMLKDSNMQ